MGNKFLIDWSKPPEIIIEKKICPLCKKPTGQQSDCYNIVKTDEDDEDDQFHIRSLEVDGHMEPVLSEQCYYRRNNQFYLYTNYPLSQPLVLTMGSVEGVEKLTIQSPYRAELTIARQFDDKEVKNNLIAVYDIFCERKKQEFMRFSEEQESILDGIEEQEDNDSG